MSNDLQDLFDDAGRGAPPVTLDTDYVVRRGRRVRARRRVVVGTTALVGVGVVGVGVAAVGSTALTGGAASLAPGQSGAGAAVGTASTMSSTATPPPVGYGPSTSPTPDLTASPPPGGPTPSLSPTPAGSPPPSVTVPADLQSVALADPAPGFPVRRWVDDVSQEDAGPGLPLRWVATFGLATRPELRSTSPAGNVTFQANGPEVSMFVGDYATPVHLRGLNSQPVAGSPTVAGVTGHLARYTEKGATFSVLYFSTGKFTVEIIGSEVTTAQLVALGDALTGLR